MPPYNLEADERRFEKMKLENLYTGRNEKMRTEKNKSFIASKRKRIIAAGAAFLLALSLVGCSSLNAIVSQKQEPAETTSQAEQQEPAESTSQIEQQESAASVPAEKTLADNITVTGVGISEVGVRSASFDSYDAEPGYIIEATVANDNDVSCDVTPYFAVDITSKDDYGAEQTKREIIFGESMFTPYGPEMYSFVQPVGLAPHETKSVRYYIYMNGANPLQAVPLAGTHAAVEGTGSDAAIDLRGDFDEFYSSSEAMLANVEIVDFDVKEAASVYVPVSEWGSGAVLTEDFDDGSAWGGYPTYETFISGSVTNNTDERWKSADVQFDFILDGQALNAAAVRGTYYSLSHVDKGASAELSEQSIVTAQNDYEAVLTPALLAYEPDEQSGN